MSRTLTINNETHWRTTDIRRIVRMAIDAGGADPKLQREVNVKFTRKAQAHFSVKVQDGKQIERITVRLPRRGSKDPHPVAMVALAASHAVDVDENTPLLPFSDVYALANYLAHEFAFETWRLDPSDEPDWNEELEAVADSVAPPNWGEGEKLYIAKYKDPLKDATYLDFVKKKETAIKREATRIATLEGEIATRQRHLKEAIKRKKKHEKALRDARERRK